MTEKKKRNKNKKIIFAVSILLTFIVCCCCTITVVVGIQTALSENFQEEYCKNVKEKGEDNSVGFIDCEEYI
jgi:hypothetical protein